MKVKSILTSIFIMTLTTTNAQTTASKPAQAINQCEELKKENVFLKNALKINEPIKSAEQDNLEIKLISAKGNIKTQIIKIDFLITNKVNNKSANFEANSCKFITMEGDLIPVTKYFTVPHADLSTDVPIKTSIEIGTVLPKNSILKLVSFVYGLYPNNVRGTVEFTDIPVEWK